MVGAALALMLAALLWFKRSKRWGKDEDLPGNSEGTSEQTRLATSELEESAELMPKTSDAEREDSMEV